jgi:hypothetical protein
MYRSVLLFSNNVIMYGLVFPASTVVSSRFGWYCITNESKYQK